MTWSDLSWWHPNSWYESSVLVTFHTAVTVPDKSHLGEEGFRFFFFSWFEVQCIVVGKQNHEVSDLIASTFRKQREVNVDARPL